MKEGDWVEVEIFKITSFGAFVRMPGRKKGLIHISQVSDNFIEDINEHLKVGERLRARIINIAKNGKIDLSLRKEPGQRKNRHGAVDKNNTKKSGFKFLPFEDKLNKLAERTSLELVEPRNK